MDKNFHVANSAKMRAALGMLVQLLELQNCRHLTSQKAIQEQVASASIPYFQKAIESSQGKEVFYYELLIDALLAAG